MAPDANILLQLVIIGTLVMSLLTGWAVLTSNRRVQRREVTMADSFATRESVDREQRLLRRHIELVAADVATIRAEMKCDRNEIMESGELRASKLHERINQVEQRISDVPAQVITTLRNTGALK